MAPAESVFVRIKGDNTYVVICHFFYYLVREIHKATVYSRLLHAQTLLKDLATA